MLHRRYSHFRWLYSRAVAAPPPPPPSDPHELEAERKKRGALRIPPRTMTVIPCMPCVGGDGWRDEDLVERREEELGGFVGDLLTRRGYADHPAVVAFLELDGFVATTA